MHQLWNSIAENYKDQSWWHLTLQKYSEDSRIEFACVSFHDQSSHLLISRLFLTQPSFHLLAFIRLFFILCTSFSLSVTASTPAQRHTNSTNQCMQQTNPVPTYMNVVIINILHLISIVHQLQCLKIANLSGLAPNSRTSANISETVRKRAIVCIDH